MPTLSANKTLSAPSQAASLPVPAPAQVVRVVRTYPDLAMWAEQVVPRPAQLARLFLARGPAEPRPPGVPATPRL